MKPTETTTQFSFITASLLGCWLSVVPQLHATPLALPDIAGSADSSFTPIEEQRLGREFMRGLRSNLTLLDEPLLADYVQGLGQRLASRTKRGERGFHFFLIDQPIINAFAGPSGYIGVYSGLVLATETESELASVLAHEIAHVTQDHLARAFENAQKMSGPAAALLLAAILLGARGNADVGMAAVAGVQAATVQQQINFTRENEQEADRVGIQILAETQLDPHAMPVFFERLSKASRLYENNAPEFLRTHPVTTNRIADALGRADHYPYRQLPDDSDYFLIRAQLRERTFSDPKTAVTYFRATLRDKRYRNEAAEHYGYALALLRSHQLDAAREEARQLLRQAPTVIAYVLLAARIEAESGQIALALRSLNSALELFPGQYPLSDYYAQLALEHGQTEAAITVLDTALAHHPEQPRLYELRARVAAQRGKTAEAHLFSAEAHYLNGELETAAQQLETALRIAPLEEYDEYRIRARLRELRSQLKSDKDAK